MEFGETKNLRFLMKRLGWKEMYENILPYSPNNNEKIFVLNGFITYLSNYYIILNGQMPIKLAQELFNKYDNTKYKMRVNGSSENDSPEKSNKTHFELEKFIHEECDVRVEGLDSFVKKCKIKEGELLKKDYNNFFIPMYHIDTIKGLEVITKFIKENDIHSKWF